MNECRMTVAIHPSSRCALTAPSMSCMTSWTSILIVSFVSNLILVFGFISNPHDDIIFIGHPSTRLGVWNIGEAHPTVEHAQTNYDVLQFGR